MLGIIKINAFYRKYQWRCNNNFQRDSVRCFLIKRYNDSLVNDLWKCDKLSLFLIHNIHWHKWSFEESCSKGTSLTW